MESSLQDKEASAARSRGSRMSARDMRALDINTESWEDLAADRGSRSNTLHKQLKLGEEKLIAAAAEQRARRKERNNVTETTHRCDLCDRDCHYRIGLYSHIQKTLLKPIRQPGQLTLDGGITHGRH